MGRKSRHKRDRRAVEEAVTEHPVREEDSRPDDLGSADAGRRRGCLFCRRSDGGFTSREHIVPESLGNTELILPAGVVCDRCNHSVCSPLDTALLDFAPVAMLRTIFSVPNKRGKLPSVSFDNGTLKAKAPGQLLLQLDSRKWRTPDVQRDDGRVQWGFTGQRHDLTKKRLSLVHRSLVKMALECAWLDLGADTVLSEAFDRERAIVLQGGHHGYLVVSKSGVPEQRVQVTFQQRWRTLDTEPLLAIGVDIYGFVMVTDTLFPTPPGNVPEDQAGVLPF